LAHDQGDDLYQDEGALWLIRKAYSLVRDEDRDIEDCEEYKEIRGMRAKSEQREELVPLTKRIIKQKPDREAKTEPIRSYLKREFAKLRSKASWLTHKSSLRYD
jgi:hypothetical protein